MSLHVSVLCRWMHHDCRSRFQAQLISSSHHLSLRSLPAIRSHHQSHRRSIRSPTFASASVQSIRPFSVTGHCHHVALLSLPSSSEEPEGVTLPTHREIPDVEKSKRFSTDSRRLHLQPHEKFPVRLTELPISGDFVDHPGQYDDFPQEFSGKLFKVFNFYTRHFRRQEPDLNRLRSHFAGERQRADDIWATRHLAGLENWLDHHVDNDLRVSHLCDLLIGSLVTSPDRILSVLSTLKSIPADWEVRAHCLYLTGWIYKSEISANPDLMLQLDKHLDSLRDFHSWPPSTISLDHLRLLFWRSDKSQIKSIIAHLQESALDLNTETLLWLTMFCAKKHGMPEEAFSFLSRVPSGEMQQPSQILLQCVQVQLRHDTVVKTPHGPNFRYLPHLLQKGLVPDSRLYQCIIQRALDSDCAWVAWDVYHYLQSTDVPTTYHTHLAMLRNAFEEQYIERVDEIMSKIERDEELYRNKVVISYAMNIVRRLVYNSRRAAPSQGVAQILALYNRAYLPGPLAKFGLTYQDGPTPSETALVEPSILSIAYTIWACVLCHKHGKSVHYFWNRICRQVELGEPTVIRCLEYDLIYNAFIWLNSRHKENLHRALKVFQYMLQKEFCVPTQRTWSILICGFLYHGEREQAKKLFQLMTRHGFSIDDICGEYLPQKATLDDLEARAADVLDFATRTDGFHPVPQSDEHHHSSMTGATSNKDQQPFESAEDFLNPYLRNFSDGMKDSDSSSGQHFGREDQHAEDSYSYNDFVDFEGQRRTGHRE